MKRIHYVGGPASADRSHGEMVVLLSSNENYPPIYVHPGDDFRIYGVVTSVVFKVL